LNQFFYKELCDIRKPGAPITIDEGFHDDKMLRRVVKKGLSYTNDINGIFRWFYMCSCGFCTNFRPATVKALLEVWGPKEHGKYLDTSAGYGARCLGAHFAKNIDTYVGIDPNTADSAKDEIEYLDTYYPTGTDKQVLKMGSEDFTSKAFPQYQNYFDIGFTSPPYFNTEQYSSDETQSYKKFPTYAKWCEGFLQATIDNTCSALKADGIFAMNIFEKVPNIKEIIKLFLANNGWYVFKTEKYLLKTMPGLMKDPESGEKIVKTRGKYDNYEPIFIAAHWSRLLKEGKITKEQALQFKKRAVKDTHAVEL
jgi:tRNA1(Val) A37 N6-methylase TrmN6